MRRFLLLLVLAASGIALAQQAVRPGVEKFHAAARLFVAGDTAAAASEARAGLRVAPDDPALQALLAAIERRPPPEPAGAGGEQDQPPPESNDDGQPGGQDDEARQPPQQQRGAGGTPGRWADRSDAAR